MSNNLIPKHYILFLGGLSGSSYDLIALANNLETTLENIIILKPTCNNFFRSWNGIKICATKVYNYLIENINELNYNIDSKIQLSIIGQSMGGIVGRYVIYLLFMNSYFQTKIIPHTYISIVSPHLGAIELRQKIYYVISYLKLSAKELMMADDDNLLYKMTSSEFINSLSKFKHLYLYTNVRNDLHVPYFSSAIKNTNENINIKKSEIIEDKYDLTEKSDGLIKINNLSDELNEKINIMKNNLNKLNWNRVYICGNVFLAHYVITPFDYLFPESNKIINHISKHFVMNNIK
jgi:hypothetical protein